MKKKLLSLVFITACVLCVCACGKKEDKKGDTDVKDGTFTSTDSTSDASGDASVEIPSLSEEGLLTRESENLLSGKHNIEIEIENYGTIALTLDADLAPVTVTNYLDLVTDGFYNGLTFHRIINGFMIQGGCPLGLGYGDSGRNIEGEFSSNGIKNDLAHTRGVISMARSGDPNSASCQFFIMHEDAPHLDGDYAAFGQVTSGIEVVDAICKNTPVVDMNGTVLAPNQPKIKEIRIVK